ncbi:MAG: helix-turn-helix transcriptional regulator [Methanosphaera sp.]|nr:helix-turn-helix transcriptional regulator [Methanosphaera sp.]
MSIDNEKIEYYERKYERNPVEEAIKSISNKWTLHILRDLFMGRTRFNEFKENRESLDNKALSRCLKNMENNGLIVKRIINDDPTFTEYELTKKGRSLNKVFYELLLFALNDDENNTYYTPNAKKELKEFYEEILDIQ